VFACGAQELRLRVRGMNKGRECCGVFAIIASLILIPGISISIVSFLLFPLAKRLLNFPINFFTGFLLAV
jgi:hypothetical protein